MVVSVFGDNGELSELMSVSLPSPVKDGCPLLFGDEENYLLASFIYGGFVLVSLDRKRVEFEVPQV